MAPLSLYEEGLRNFRDDFKKIHREPKYETQLEEYLKARNSADDAKKSCESLQEETQKKYSAIKVGDNVVIKEKWITNILSNIENFIAVGNFTMRGAPESVGLAWFAITKALGAIQSNFQLYTLFGSGLTDVTEMMVVIKHFDQMYDERKKPEFEASELVKALFGHVRATYAAILDFGFSVHRHLSGGKLAKLRHGFKDFFGAEVPKFQGKLDVIVALKVKVLQAADGAFQAKSFQRFDNIQDVVKSVEAQVIDIKEFQQTSAEFYQAQETWRNEILRGLEDVKASSRPKTRWEYAMQDFNKNKDLLQPLKGASGPLAEALDDKHSGTGQWVYDTELYKQWLSSPISSTLCLSGQPGSGKSTLLASIVEKIDDETDDSKVIVLYLSCDMSTSETGDKSPQSLTRIGGTLMYQLYECATFDDQDSVRLEACNKVFSNPKQQKLQKLASAGSIDPDLPDFAEALRQLSMHLEADVIIAVDSVDRMSTQDQVDFFESLERLRQRSKDEEPAPFCIRILTTTRADSTYADLTLTNSLSFLDVGHFNKVDICTMLSDALDRMTFLSNDERAIAKDAVLQEAGSDFKYVVQVAIPFLKQPFQRPLANRLKSLPKGISDAYNQFLQGLPDNYLQLLKTALLWTLFAPSSVRVIEIMEAFTGTYASLETDAPLGSHEDYSNHEIRKASLLEVQQLRSATGPFLDIWEDKSGQWWVALRDASQVRQFCVRDPGANHPVSSLVETFGPVCDRCNAVLERSTTLEFTERQIHLDLAIASLKHLNDPNFQKHCGLLPPGVENQLQDADAPTLPNSRDSSHSEGEKPAKRENLQEEDEGITGNEVDPENVPCEDNLQSTASEDEGEAPVSVENQESEHADTASSEMNAKNESDAMRDCLDCGQSDESQDDDDRLETSWDESTNDTDQEAYEEYYRQQTNETFRYEANAWYYHLRQAEKLWSDELSGCHQYSDLVKELDRFSDNSAFFTRWQWMLLLREMDGAGEEQIPWKPLHIAAFLGLTSWADHLLSKDNDVNGYSDERTPLHAAALKADRLETLRLLLGHGADPNAVDGRRQVPCTHWWLLKDSSAEAVELFAKNGASLRKETPYGVTPLHYFTISADDDPKALALLLNKADPDNQPDINARNVQGETPLHYLLGRRDVPMELLEMLIAEGADVNAEDSGSQRPLQNASYWGDMKVLRMILPRVSDINDPDRHGRTALHEAAWAGHRELVETLLANGANANVCDFHNRTPLFFACLADPGGRIGNSRATIKLLIETLHQKGFTFSEINQATKRQRTPLRQAASCGLSDVVEDLLHMMAAASGIDIGASINLPDTRKGRTALHCAAARGHTHCVKLLLDFDADSTLLEKKSKTALTLCYEQWALTNQSCFGNTALLLCDKDPLAAISDAELPAIAAANNHLPVLKKLLSLNADLNRPDQYGWTPLDHAKRTQNTEVEKYLKVQLARPSRWLDPGDCVVLSDSGRDIAHSGGRRIVLSSNHPLSADLPMFYFEIQSAESEIKNPNMGIGYCTLGASGLDYPGWPPRSRAPSTRSWAYHGDDGAFFDGGGHGVGDYRLPYNSGDVVGCGVDLEKGVIWFTRNGERLKTEFEGVKGRLFPVVGMVDQVELKTNFGEQKFKWEDWYRVAGIRLEEEATVPDPAVKQDETQAVAGAEPE